MEQWPWALETLAKTRSAAFLLNTSGLILQLTPNCFAGRRQLFVGDLCPDFLKFPRNCTAIAMGLHDNLFPLNINWCFTQYLLIVSQAPEINCRNKSHVSKRFCLLVCCTPFTFIFLSCPSDSSVASMATCYQTQPFGIRAGRGSEGGRKVVENSCVQATWASFCHETSPLSNHVEKRLSCIAMEMLECTCAT